MAEPVNVVVKVEERRDGWWVITDGPESIVPAEAREFGPVPNLEEARRHAVSVASLLSTIYDAGTPSIGNPNRS